MTIEKVLEAAKAEVDAKFREGTNNDHSSAGVYIA